MKNVFIIPFLLIVAGCGMNSDESLNENMDDVEDADKIEGGIIVDVEEEENQLYYVLEEKEKSNNGEKVMEYSIQNDGEENLTLNFDTSMKYDYYILNENGEEVYRDSDEKSYNQSPEKLELKPDEKESYELELPELEAGEYILVVNTAAEKFKDEKAKMKFEI